MCGSFDKKIVLKIPMQSKTIDEVNGFIKMNQPFARVVVGN